MIWALICLALAVAAGVAVILYDKREVGWGIGTACVGIAVVLVVWAGVAWVYSPYQKDRCAERAAGYDLPDSDWSIKQGCRVVLRSGQLVPENRIRITTDGHIVVSND